MSRTQKILAVLWGLNLLWPLVLVFGGDYLFARITSRPYYFAAEFGPRVMRVVLTGIPFLVLTGFTGKQLREEPAGVSVGAVWIVAGILVGAFVAMESTLFVSALRHPGKANIGLGILLLFAPFLLAFAVPFLYRWLQAALARHTDETLRSRLRT